TCIRGLIRRPANSPSLSLSHAALPFRDLAALLAMTDTHSTHLLNGSGQTPTRFLAPARGPGPSLPFRTPTQGRMAAAGTEANRLSTWAQARSRSQSDRRSPSFLTGRRAI